MRSRGLVILIGIVGALAALLVINHVRSNPATTAAGPPAFPRYNLASTEASSVAPQASQPMSPLRSAEPGDRMPITVRCGDTVLAIQPSSLGEARAVKVDCNQVSPNQPVNLAQSDGSATARPVVQRSRRKASHQYARARVRPREQKHRSWQKEALIIGGSAGAGTAIGAIAGGKKGAAIGAVSGGAAGLAYDLATRKKQPK